MAIVKSDFLKMIRKSVGNNTFCYRKGQIILKGKISNNPSHTLLQEKQRCRMRQLVELSNLFYTPIQMGFPQRPATHSAYNMFIKFNQAAVIVNDQLEATVDYTKIVLSEGKLEIPHVEALLNAEGTKITFTHAVGEFGRRAEPTDLLYAVLAEKEVKQTKVVSLNTRESTTPVEVPLPSSWSKECVYVYVFVLSANKHKASNTQNLWLS